MIRKTVLGGVAVAMMGLAAGCGDTTKNSDPKATTNSKDADKLKPAVPEGAGGGAAAPTGSAPKKMAPGGPP